MKKRTFLFVSFVLILSTLLSACGAPATPAAAPAAATAAPAPVAQTAPTTAPAAAAPTAAGAAAKAAEPTKAAAPTAAGPTAVPPTPGPMATSAPATLETFGLKAGKPYNGTKLKFLICCNTAAQFYSLNEKTKQFTDMTGITVEWGSTPYVAFQQQIMTEGAAGGSNYDLVAWVDAWGPGLYNFIQPLDSYIAADKYNIGDFPKAFAAPGVADGKVLGIPMRGHAYTLFYRKDVFDQLGLKPPTTWAELEQDAQTIQSKTKLSGITPYYGINGGQNVFTWVSLLWSNGGDIFDAKNKPIFNNPAGVEATQRYIDWLLKQKIAPAGSKTFFEGDGSQEMVAGRTAMWIGWSWYYANFTNRKLVAPEVLGNVAFTTIPSWEGKGPSASYGQIWETGIMKGSKNKDAAWEYLKWMTNPATEKWVALDKSDPKRDNVVVVHSSNMQDPQVNAQHNGLQKNMFSVLQTARTEPLIPDWLQVQGILETAINSMANGAPVQATLDKAAADTTTLLTQLGYYK